MNELTAEPGERWRVSNPSQGATVEAEADENGFLVTDAGNRLDASAWETVERLDEADED